MFKFVGWLVVTSFALYGVAQFTQNHLVLQKSPEA